MEIKAKDLKKGDRFKYGKQRNLRTFNLAYLLTRPNLPKAHQGKLLVILDDYTQIICDPEMIVNLEDDSGSERCPKCGSQNLLNVSDNYTACQDCAFQFVS